MKINIVFLNHGIFKIQSTLEIILKVQLIKNKIFGMGKNEENCESTIS